MLRADQIRLGPNTLRLSSGPAIGVPRSAAIRVSYL